MASLLDIFGGSSGNLYGGLLGEEGLAQAKRQAQADALLNLSASLMKAGAPSRTPQSLGLGLVEGLGAAQKSYKSAMDTALQEKMTQAKIAEALAAKKRQADVNTLLGQAVQTVPAVRPDTPLMDLYGREVAGPNMPQPATTKFDLASVTPKLMATAEGRAALKELSPEYKAVGDYLYQIPIGGVPTQVAGQPKMTADMQGYKLAQEQGFKGTFMDYQAASKKPLVVMNEGQKGFENTSALRKQFQSEPIYKEFQDLGLAYKQVTNAINAGTPIGDTAAATKIMKMLDPGSVVRETELGMAMAATGKLDRLKNLMDLYITGKKLTPTQRVEFQSLANNLYAAGQQAYNKKRNEYELLGQSFGLNTDIALGESARGIGLPSGVKVIKEQ